MINSQKNTTRARKSAVRLQPVQNSRSMLMRSNPNIIFNQPASRIYCTYNPKPIQIVNYVHCYQPERSFHENVKPKPTNFIYEKSNNQLGRLTLDVKPEPPYQKHSSQIVLNEIDDNKKTNTNIMEKQNSIYKTECHDLNSCSISIDQKSMSSEPINLKNVLIEVQNSNNLINSKDTIKKSNDDKKKVTDNLIREKNSKSAGKIKFPSKPNTTEKMVSVQSAVSKNNSQNMPHEINLAVQKNITDRLKFPNAPMKFHAKKKFTEKIMKRPELPTVSESQALINHSVKLVDAVSVHSNVSRVEDNNNSSRYITDPFAPIDESEDDIDEAVPEFAADYRVFHVDFPENTVPFGTKIPGVRLPKEFTKGAVIGVFISEIHSPFKFWFHPHKEHHELDVLMCGIESFYERLGDADLLIPKSCITPGQVCVALYNDMWHRAEILTIVNKNKVKVLFVDYGTVSDVGIQCIKYLQNRFAETPVQAIRGSLSHIKPVSQIWQKRAIKEFLSLVAEVFLYAQIIEIDEKESTVYMVLCDTNSGQAMQINKLLVERGFARLDNEWDENKIKQVT